MKKTAIVIASVILFVILIGVNFLLWDNSSKRQNIESLENQDESKQQSIQYLVDENRDLEKTIGDLNQQIIELQLTIADKEKEISLLEEENLNRYNIVGDKNTIIQQLKSHIDLNYFRAILDEWVKNINDEAYFVSYYLQHEVDIFNDRAEIGYENYYGIFDNVEFMEIIDFDVRVMDDGETLDQDARDRIKFNALINVELTKDEEGFPINDAIFNSGANYFEVTMAFDRVKWKWYIWTID